MCYGAYTGKISQILFFDNKYWFNCSKLFWNQCSPLIDGADVDAAGVIKGHDEIGRVVTAKVDS